MIGPMPLYFIDILAALVLLLGRRQFGDMFRRHRKISVVVLLFMLSLLPTTFSEYFRMGFMEPTYLLGRAWLHVIAIWSLAGLLRNPAHLKGFLIGVSAGCLVTATVGILNSLPITGPWTRAHILTIDMLYPRGVVRGLDAGLRGGKGLDADLLMMLDEGLPDKGDSLVGKANITGLTLIMMLPFIVGMPANMHLKPLLRTVLNIGIVIVFVGLLATYSRLTYLALAATCLGYFLYDRGEFARRVLPVMSILVAGILLVGIQSSFLKFEFLIDKFDLTNERYEGTNMARVYSYTRPMQLVFNDPSYIFRGAGRAHLKLREKQRNADILELKQGEMHSTFAASIFWRGFISMFLLFYLCYLLVTQTYSAMKYAKEKRLPNEWLITASFISFMGMAAPWLLDHHFVSRLSGHMYLFMYFALIIACIDSIKFVAREDITPKVPNAKPARAGRVLQYRVKAPPR